MIRNLVKAPLISLFQYPVLVNFIVGFPHLVEKNNLIPRRSMYRVREWGKVVKP